MRRSTDRGSRKVDAATRARQKRESDTRILQRRSLALRSQSPPVTLLRMHHDLRPAKISPFWRHSLGQDRRPLRPLPRPVSVFDRTTSLDKFLQQPRPHLLAEPGLRIKHLDIAHTLFDDIIIGQAGIFDPSFELSVDFGVIGGGIGDFGRRSGRGCEVELGLERRDDVAPDVGACAFGFRE